MAFDPFMQSKTAQDIINNHMNAEEKPAFSKYFDKVL